MKKKFLSLLLVLLSTNAFSAVVVKCHIGLPGSSDHQVYTTTWTFMGEAQLYADYCENILDGVAHITVVDNGDGNGGGNGDGNPIFDDGHIE